MTPKLVYMILIFAAGVCWPMQAAMNGQLKRSVSQPLVAVMVNGGGALLLAGLAMLVLGVWAKQLSTPSAAAMRSVPWWAYLGGVFSVLVIIAQSSAAGPLGAALLVTLFIAGQGISSAVFDQFGLLGFDRKPVSLTRGLGVIAL
ncbi:MAG: DMT family transporter, partial [Planctomycetota bacterium]